MKKIMEFSFDDQSNWMAIIEFSLTSIMVNLMTRWIYITGKNHFLHFINGVNNDCIKRIHMVIDDCCSTAFDDLLYSFHLFNGFSTSLFCCIIVWNDDSLVFVISQPWRNIVFLCYFHESIETVGWLLQCLTEYSEVSKSNTHKGIDSLQNPNYHFQ